MTGHDIQERVNSLLKEARMRFKKKEYDDALDDLKAAEVIDPQNPEILYHLGIVYARQGLHKTAVDYYNKLIQLPFSFVDLLTVRKLMAFSQILINRFNEALPNLFEVIRLSSHDIAAIGMAGFCYEKTGRIEEALDMHRKILVIDPSHLNSMNSIAYLYALQGKNLDKAVEMMRQVLKINQDNAAYNDTMGYIYIKRNQPDLAKEFLKKALQKDPSNQEIRAHLNELLR